MNETLYWIIEYFKVLISYGCILFVWPLVVFNHFLKNKSKTFKFAFCVVSMIGILNVSILMLGTIHVLNVWVLRVLFYGIFIYSIVRKINMDKQRLSSIKYITTGTMGRKTFATKVGTGVKGKIKTLWKSFCNFFKDNSVAYILLILVIIYGMVYFSWNAFQDYSYGASDMYVHHKWIYGLVQGESFVAGVYPEGMHCVIYAIYSLFGVKIYSSLMFLAGIHVSITLISAYILFKELFKWKYTPILALTLFLILDVKATFPVLSMSRMAWTLPQEFGYPMVFLCGAYLIKYLKRKEEEKNIKNDKLMIFMLALAGTISIHFYVTIMAFFLCLMIVIPLIPKLFKNRNFINLLAAVLIGVVIAFIPMLAALATGKKFQGSINWAISLIKNSIACEEQFDFDEIKDNTIEFARSQFGIVQVASKNTKQFSIDLSKKMITRGSGRPLKEKKNDIYNKTYVFMHGKDRAVIIVWSQAIILAIWLILRISAIFIKKKDGDYDTARYDGYLMLFLIAVMFNLLNNTKSLGLPEFMESGRICALTQLFSVSVFFVPIDLILSFPYLAIKKTVGAVAAVTGILITISATVYSGQYHSFLYYCLGRYNGAVVSAFSIIEDTKPSEFTIVSTTEEYYQIIDSGYHEELVDFINSAYYKDSYTLPTRYVFVYVEKKPIKYPHYHFASGPKWLANQNYPSYFGTYVSQDPDVICGEINDEDAFTDYGRFASGTINVYSNLESRVKLESKAYRWCQEFDKLYPGELKKYYEDDYFVCYYFDQNQRSVYELSIKNQ